jgi:hypothetical protein
MSVLILILYYVQVQSYWIEDSWTRLNTTVRRHNTGLISKHPFHGIKLVVCSHWCMVTESIMKWVFWYLSYIISSYKHWNVECVWDNHPFILHLLVVFYILVYWLILDVLIFVVFYTLVYWLIKVSWNGCFDINPVLCLRTVVLSLVQLSSIQYEISKHPLHDTFSDHTPMWTYNQFYSILLRGGCLRHILHFNVCTRT